MRRTTAALLLASCALAAAATIFACSSDDADGGPAVDVSDVGQCTTATAEDASAAKFPHSALPTGLACAASTSCHLPVDDCANDFLENPVGPNLQEYECVCTGGAWACTLAVPVDEECGPVPDAGEDASPGADLDAPVDSPSDVENDALADAPLDSPADSPADSPFDSPLDAGDAAPDAL